jgi:hypothetical protein
MARQDNDRAKNRDDEMRPGAPPRSAYHPPGSGGSSRSAKTRTDPATGEPRRGAPAPARSSSEDAPPHPRN